jgi:plastocyanin
MNKNSIVVILLLLLIGGGAYFLMNRSATTNPDALMEDSTDPTTAKQEDRVMQQESASEASVEEGTLKEFTVISKPFLFNQKELRVKKGDTVRITLDNQEGTHDFVIDEFNAKTKTLNAGQEETIEFVADKAGTFEFYCSVGNHRAMGMTGNLIVE